MRACVVVSVAADLEDAVALAAALVRAGLEVSVFAMSDAVAALADRRDLQTQLVDVDADVAICASSAHQRGLGGDAFLADIVRGSQDDHARMVAHADRVVSFS